MGFGGGGLGFMFHHFIVKFDNNKVLNVEHAKLRKLKLPLTLHWRIWRGEAGTINNKSLIITCPVTLNTNEY